MIAGTYVRKYKVSYPEGAAAAEMATATADDVYVHWIQCYICGYHVYQRIWYPTIGEILGTAREWDNTHDRYTVAVLEVDTCCVVIFLSFTHAMATIDCGLCDTS